MPQIILVPSDCLLGFCELPHGDTWAGGLLFRDETRWPSKIAKPQCLRNSPVNVSVKLESFGKHVQDNTTPRPRSRKTAEHM